eukprot:4523538-Prymnesium_polylepis.2
MEAAQQWRCRAVVECEASTGSAEVATKIERRHDRDVCRHWEGGPLTRDRPWPQKLCKCDSRCIEAVSTPKASCGREVAAMELIRIAGICRECTKRRVHASYSG